MAIYALSIPKAVIAMSKTPTNPFPGPTIVIWLPPIIETIIPPTTAAIMPAMGGASLAMANPNPKGKAIRLTTKPENMFLGNTLKKSFMLFFFGLIVKLEHLLVVRLKYVLYHVETNGPKRSFLMAHSSLTNPHGILVHNAR